MEEIWKKLKDPKAVQVQKVTSNSCTADDLLNQALANTNSDNLSAMAVQFDKLLQEDGAALYPLPKKPSGFKQVRDGVMDEVHVQAEEHGLNCVNPGHQGSANTLKMDNLNCISCFRSGPPMRHRKKQWSLPPMKPIISTKPMFLLVLVSRSSSGQEIKQEVFDNLRMTIEKQQRKILDFLKNKTGLDYDIHILAQIGHNGSIFSLLSDSDVHVRKNDDQERVPASHISDLFFFHKLSDSMVGYMSNSPGDLTGKLANHYHNLHNLKKGGIQPSSVVFMANGVNVVEGKGVEDNFTMFTGEELIDHTKPFVPTNFAGFTYTTEPTVEGYVTGMTNDAGSRLYRATHSRKMQM